MITHFAIDYSIKILSKLKIVNRIKQSQNDKIKISMSLIVL